MWADGEMGCADAQPGDSLTDERVVWFLSWDLTPIGTNARFISAEIDTDGNGLGDGLVFPEGTGLNTLRVVHMP